MCLQHHARDSPVFCQSQNHVTAATHSGPLLKFDLHIVVPANLVTERTFVWC